MSERYLNTKAVVFKDNVIIPIWMCKYEKDKNYGDMFWLNDNESSNHIQEAVWDCKKESFISFYIVEKKEEAKFKVGDKVIFVDTLRGALVTTVEEVVEADSDYYYEKVSKKICLQDYVI